MAYCIIDETYLAPPNLAANFIVSFTVKEPMSASSCSTYELIRRKASDETVAPLTSVDPEVLAPDAAARWARTLRRVVLPQPEGPIRAHISPASYALVIGIVILGNVGMFVGMFVGMLVGYGGELRYVPASTIPLTPWRRSFGCFVLVSLTVTVMFSHAKLLTVVFRRYASVGRRSRSGE